MTSSISTLDACLNAFHAHRTAIAVPVEWIDILGLRKAVLLSQIFYWYRPAKSGNSKLHFEKDGHLWIAKTLLEWECETGLKERTLSRAFLELEQLELVVRSAGRFSGKKCLLVRLGAAVPRLLASPDDFQSRQNGDIESNDLNHAKMATSITPLWRDPYTETTEHKSTVVEDNNVRSGKKVEPPKPPTQVDTKPKRVPYKKIKDSWNEFVTTLSQTSPKHRIAPIYSMSRARKDKIKKRWDRIGPNWDAILEQIAHSRLLQGLEGKWVLTFDWLFGGRNDSDVMVLEGKYRSPDAMQETTESTRKVDPTRYKEPSLDMFDQNESTLSL